MYNVRSRILFPYASRFHETTNSPGGRASSSNAPKGVTFPNRLRPIIRTNSPCYIRRQDQARTVPTRFQTTVNTRRRHECQREAHTHHDIKTYRDRVRSSKWVYTLSQANRGQRSGRVTTQFSSLRPSVRTTIRANFNQRSISKGRVSQQSRCRFSKVHFQEEGGHSCPTHGSSSRSVTFQGSLPTTTQDRTGPHSHVNGQDRQDARKPLPTGQHNALLREARKLLPPTSRALCK